MKIKQLFTAMCALLLTFSMQAFADLGDLNAVLSNPASTPAQIDAAVAAAYGDSVSPNAIAEALDNNGIDVAVGAGAMGKAGMNPATVSSAYRTATGSDTTASRAQTAAAQAQGNGNGFGGGFGQGRGQGSGAPGGGNGGGGGGGGPSQSTP